MRLQRKTVDDDLPILVGQPKPMRLKRKEILEYDDPEIEIVPNLDFDIDRYIKERDDNLIPRSVNMVNRYRDNPFAFIQEHLQVRTDCWQNDSPPRGWTGNFWPIWSKQREIVQALVQHKRVAVRSGHGLGKSFIAALCVLYLTYVWRGLGVTTAPTFRQVEKVLWGEIHYMYNQAGGRAKLGGDLKKTSLELGDKWYVEGFSTRDPKAAITGFHEENVFAVIDEAGGVAQEVFDSLEGILTSGNSFILLIGNPIDNIGPFADAFAPNSPYYKIHLSCWDCPNVKHGRDIYPKLVTHKWPKEKLEQWGEDSNLYRVRVKGDFPVEGMNSLIPIKYIELAHYGLDKPADRVVSFGMDVARQGTDRTVIGVRYASGRFEIVDVSEKQRETEAAGRMARVYKDFISRASTNHSRPPINIDDIGVGGGVVDILYDDDYPVNGINVSESPDDVTPSDDDELDPEKFLNKRAYYYWKLRRAYQKGEVSIEDEILAHELSRIPLKFTAKGQIKIPDKDEIRKELKGKSPDYADCQMLAWAEETWQDDGNLVRFI